MWISVKDDLPELYQDGSILSSEQVLVFINAPYGKDKAFGRLVSAFKGEYQWLISNSSPVSGKYVTHWQYLQDDPK